MSPFHLPSPPPCSPCPPWLNLLRNSSAFSLVELLVVVAIIGMMVGLSAMAVSGMRAPAVQHAADQVMSGLSLARQIAITKNTQAAFLIATNTNSGFPAEPYRYWSVVYSNKGATNWTFAKDWEELPNGAIFGELLGSAYSQLNTNTYAITVGSAVNSSQFTGNNTFTIFKDTNSNNAIISNTIIPCIRFSSDGSTAGTERAIRVVPGSVIGGNATITSTNQYYFVETDTSIGRIRMRPPESYQ